MRRSLVVLSTLCALSTAARAEDWSLHLLTDAQLGWTDNVRSVPDHPTAGAGPAWDVFLGIRPGALLSLASPRAIHELSYTLDGNLYLRDSQLSTLFHRAAWRGFFLLSPRTELTTGVMGSFGNSNLFPNEAAASAGTVTVVRTGQVEAASVAADEGLSFVASPELRLTQGAVARFDRATATGNGITTGGELGLRFGADRAFRDDALGVTVSSSYLQLTRPVGGGASDVTDDQISTRAAGMWRRDLSQYWTSVVAGGGAVVVPVGGTGKTVVVPTASARLAYFPTWGTASVGVGREVAPNLLIAENTVTDSAVATGWLPLPWLRKDPTRPRLTVQATVGFARVQLIDSNAGQVVSGFDDVITDVAGTWMIEPSVGLSLRYQRMWQSADTSASAVIPVQGFTRNTVMLQFTARWPDRLAAQIPLRDTLRVDRSNVTPVGEEVPGQGGVGAVGGASGSRP